jgi:ankyrin repeat protein
MKATISNNVALVAQITDQMVQTYPTVDKSITLSRVVNAFMPEDQKRPLHLAAIHGHHELTKRFISLGADINAQDIDGLTPLHHAVKSNKLDIVKALISEGADLHIQDNDEKTTLDYMSISSDVSEAIKQELQLASKQIKLQRFDQAQSLNQEIILSKMPSVVTWMQQYEQERYKATRQAKLDGLEQQLAIASPEEKVIIEQKLATERTQPALLTQEFLTQEFQDRRGLCFGFATRVAEAAITANMEGFVQKMQDVYSSTIPLSSASASEKQIFYKKMNLFLLEMTQLQATSGRKRSENAGIQVSLDIINEASETPRKVRAAYFIEDRDQLLEWAKKADVGASLVMHSSGHAISMYVDIDKRNGKKIVGFFDSSADQADQILEYYQEDLSYIPSAFNPFKYKSAPEKDTILMCEEIVSSANLNPIVGITEKPMVGDRSGLIRRVGAYGTLESYTKLRSLGLSPIEQNHLSYAAFYTGNYKILSQFLSDEKQILPNGLDGAGNNILHLAVENESSPTGMKILAAIEGIDVNHRNSSGMTPLHLAIAKGNMELVKLLVLDTRVDLNLQNSIGKTPVDLAIASGNIEVLKSIRARLDLNHPKSETLDSAIEARNRELVIQAERARAAILAKREQAIYYAHNPGMQSKIYEALKTPAPVHFAIKNGNFKLAEVLVLSGQIENLNHQNRDGTTPLHAAIEKCKTHPGAIEIVKILLSNDQVKVNLRNLSGMTPLDLAIATGKTELAELLVSSSKVDVTPKTLEAARITMPSIVLKLEEKYTQRMVAKPEPRPVLGPNTASLQTQANILTGPVLGKTP